MVELIRNTVSASEAGPLLTCPYRWGSTCQPGGPSRSPWHWQTLNPKSCLPGIMRLLKSRFGFSASELPLSAGLLGFSAANKLANTSREKQQRTPGSSLCGPEGLRFHPAVLSSVLGCTIAMDRLSSWQKPNQEDSKEQVETPESASPPPDKTANPDGTAENGAILRNLMNTGVEVTILPPFNGSVMVSAKIRRIFTNDDRWAKTYPSSSPNRSCCMRCGILTGTA